MHENLSMESVLKAPKSHACVYTHLYSVNRIQFVILRVATRFDMAVTRHTFEIDVGSISLCVDIFLGIEYQ